MNPHLHNTLVEPSPQGFDLADRHLRRAIPYYSKEDYVVIPHAELKLLEGVTFSLQYPQEFSAWRIAISFTKIEGRDDVMWVRSTNWRCENEPNGAMKIAEARKLYARLIATGMQAF